MNTAPMIWSARLMYHPCQELALGGAISDGTVLASELEYYKRHKPEYLKTFPGLYVLIKGDQMLGPFPSSEVALEAGLNRFGLTPFLVKQVLEHEPIGFLPFFSRARERDADL